MPSSHAAGATQGRQTNMGNHVFVTCSGRRRAAGSWCGKADRYDPTPQAQGEQREHWKDYDYDYSSGLDDTRQRGVDCDGREAAAAKQGKLSLKVSTKGAVSIYGFGKWPVTLYRDQMERLLDNADQIKAFIEANADLLHLKGE